MRILRFYVITKAVTKTICVRKSKSIGYYIYYTTLHTQAKILQKVYLNEQNANMTLVASFIVI